MRPSGRSVPPVAHASFTPAPHTGFSINSVTSRTASFFMFAVLSQNILLWQQTGIIRCYPPGYFGVDTMTVLAGKGLVLAIISATGFLTFPLPRQSWQPSPNPSHVGQITSASTCRGSTFFSLIASPLPRRSCAEPLDYSATSSLCPRSSNMDSLIDSPSSSWPSPMVRPARRK